MTMNAYKLPMVLKLASWGLLLGGLTMLQSCSREDTESFEDAADLLRVDAVLESTLESVDGASLRFGAGAGPGAGFGGPCSWGEIFGPCVAVSSGSTGFPDTTVLTFDPTCTGFGGIVRGGRLVVVLTDSLTSTGATRSLFFEDFSADGITLNGSIVLTHTGLDAAGNPVYNRVTALTWSNGVRTLNRNFSGTLTWLSGWETPECLDNVFELTGSGSLSADWGSITQTILEPLRIDRPCGYITAGSVEWDGPRGNRILDYGDGYCDDEATLSLPSGATWTVDLDLLRFRRR
jgi:hypothetical protein